MTPSAAQAVLIVDDDPDFRALVRVCVEAEGMEALEAEDCAHAIDALQSARDRIVLVLLDYWMPHMTPVRCAATLREMARPGTRVVLVSAAVDAKKRAEELGLSQWLAKPFGIDRLRDVLVEHTKR
jgi:CheY-like chemotaxis protein